MSRDLCSHLKVTQTLAPAVYDADKNAVAVDLKGFSACLLLVTAGTTLSKTVKIELEVEETDDTDNGTWTDVADDDNAVYVTQYRGPQTLLPRRGQPHRHPRHRHAHVAPVNT